MTAEEKILAYLDGSLSESESAELLHQLSVSPEKRVVLEQHIKLAELTRAAQKPFEVPMELEAMLAKRLPIVATSERVAPVAVRQGKGILTSALLLLRQYPMRFALGGLALLLSTYGVYSISNTGVPAPAIEVAQKPQGGETAPAGISGPNTTASSNSTFESNKTTGGTGTTSMPLTSDASETAKNLLASRELKADQRTNHSSERMTRNANKQTTQTQRREEQQNIDRVVNNSVVNNLIVDNSVSNTSVGSNSVANNSIGSNSAIDQASANTSSSSNEIPTAVVVSKPVAAVSQAEIREQYRHNPMEMTSYGERSPWAVRVSFGMFETFLNVKSGANSYTARLESSGFPFVGVNYSMTPSFALGAVVGYSTILTVSPQTKVAAVDGVNHVVAHTYSVDTHEWFARLAGRFSFALSEEYTAELSAEGGVLLKNISPMIAAQALLSHSLTEALDVQFSALFSGAFTSTSSSATTITDPANTDPIVYKTASLPGTSKIFLPAITGRFGVQYRF